MGVEPFLVTSSVNLVAAQRLCRKVCKECKEPTEVPEQALLDLGMTDQQVADAELNAGQGCKTCNNTGYKGRIALYEIMPLSDELRECVLQGYSAMELKREAMRLGMMSLRGSGILKLMGGEVSLEEILRVTRGD